MPFELMDAVPSLTVLDRKRLMLRILLDHGPLTLDALAAHMGTDALTLSYAQRQLANVGTIIPVGFLMGRVGPPSRLWGIRRIHTADLR